MSAGEAQASGEAELRGPEGLLFTGEAIRALKPEQLAAIGDFANRMYGVEMREVRSVGQDLGEMALRTVEIEEPTPVPMQQKDFMRFARERGLSPDMARQAFLWVKNVATGSGWGTSRVAHTYY